MKTIIDRSEVKPLSDNVKGKLVVIKPDFFKPEFRDAKYQLVLATGGHGCDVSGMGNSVFVTECCENPEHYRQERYNLIGEPTEEMIKEWKSLYGEFNEEVQKAFLQLWRRNTDGMTVDDLLEKYKTELDSGNFTSQKEADYPFILVDSDYEI